MPRKVSKWQLMLGGLGFGVMIYDYAVAAGYCPNCAKKTTVKEMVDSV
jgi:hypothetical protein